MLRASILIVEDEAVVAEDLAQKVTALGYRVLDIASTGAAALQISQAHPPDLILLDITLTGELDGIETATRLKECSDIPLVFLTAHSDSETVKRATAAGSFGYILKPFRERDLEVQLQAALYMSERIKAEQKLRKTEDLLLRAQRGAQAGVWEIDLRTERLTWSEPYYDLVGIDRSTDPSVATWLSCIHPEDRERVLATYSQSLKEKSNQNMEYRIVKPNGEVRWVQRQGQVERDEHGTARRINGITFDITERKQAEEVLRKSEDRYRKLYESIDEGFCIIQVVFDASNRAVDYVFLEINPSFEKQTGIQDAQGRSMRQIAPRHEEHWFEMYGEIALSGQSKRFEYPAVELHRWCEGYAYRVGEAVERKVGIIFNDITDRKQAEEALKAIALFPSQNPSPVLRVSSAGILLYVNEVSHQLLRDLELRLGQPVPIDLENLVKQSLKANQSQQAEYSLGLYHYLITVTPVLGADYANLYWTDITQRKQAEDALRDSEQRLTGLITLAMDAIVSVDEKQRITLFNRAAEQMFGCPADEAIGQPLDRFIPERYRRTHQDHVTSFGRTGTTTRRMGKYGTLYGLRADGEEFPLEASISHLDVGGQKVFTVILRDITQRVQSEKELRESEERWHLAITGSTDGIWDWNITEHTAFYSKRWKEIRGYREDEIGTEEKEWSSRIHPEDYEMVMRTVQSYLDKKTSAYHCEYRSQCKDGSYRWMIDRGMAVWDDQGLPVRMVGSETDITERKQAQEQLAHSQQTLLDLVERAPFGMYIVDSQFRIIQMNAGSQTGAFKNVKPVIGRDFAEAMRILWPEQVAADIVSAFRRTLDTGQPFYSPRFTNPRSDVEAVESYEWELHRIMLPNTHYGVVCYYFDSTQLRETEQALRESDERLTTALSAGQMGTWDIYLATGAISWDAKQHEIFGLPATTPPFNMAEFYALVHPHDVERIKQAAAATERTGTFSEEFRIIRPDGQIRWLTGQGAIVHNQAGHPLRMVGVNYDVTERKEAMFRLERFTEELERRVTARTSELLDSEVRLRALATELNLAEQRERTRLANDLHDYLAQLLVLGRLTLGRAKRLELPAQAEKLIKETEETLSKALNYCRTLMAELSPPVLQEQGLPAGLKWLGEHMKGQNLEVAVKVDDANSVMFSKDSAVLLFQSVRELLINVAKHGAVKKATVTMTHQDGSLTIVVRDENGFDLPAATAAATISPLSSKFGLFSIRERMKALGGTFVIQSERGKGTTATLTFPLRMPPKPPSQNGQM
jgi:PAS domain S-box-containing protein